MFGWLTNKMKHARLSMLASQLTMELDSVSDAELAFVLVTAMEFCTSFKDGSDDPLISIAIEEPKRVPADVAYDLYWQLENLLIAGKKQNQIGISTARQSMGNQFSQDFRERIRANELAIELLMAHVAGAINEAAMRDCRKISDRLATSLSSVEDSIKRIRLGHSLSGSEKAANYYEQLRDNTYSYAACFSL